MTGVLPEDYGDDWNSVVSLCVNNNKLLVSLTQSRHNFDRTHDAFSVQKKGQFPPLRTLSEASGKVKECKQILTEYEN